MATQQQSEAAEVHNTRKTSKAVASPSSVPGFKLAAGKLAGGQVTDHLSKVSADVGNYYLHFQCTHAGKTLMTAEPLRVTVTKSALPGTVRLLLEDELGSSMTSDDDLPDITLSWPVPGQTGKQSTHIACPQTC